MMNAISPDSCKKRSISSYFYTIIYKKSIKSKLGVQHVGDFPKVGCPILFLFGLPEWEKLPTSLFAVPVRQLSTHVEE